MTQLPNKLSELITVALADLAKVEADPRYMVNMWDWHRLITPVPQPDGAPQQPLCSVCLAGAVMAKSLNFPISQSTGLHGVGHEIACKMTALDLVRLGHLEDALWYLNVIRPVGVPRSYEVTDYSNDPKQFRADLENLVVMLAKHGV